MATVFSVMQLRRTLFTCWPRAQDWKKRERVVPRISLLGLMAMCLIWDEINVQKFAQESRDQKHGWLKAFRVWDKLKEACKFSAVDSCVQGREVWTSSSGDVKKMNDDASIRSPGGVGGLLRDCTRTCVLTFAELIPFPDDSILVEAMAIKRGMKFVIQYRYKLLEIALHHI
ncbi:uncharacterized protein G2W53_033478 [Senna tora]|uniref:Uncharacterized protein n=1 Tax=Senna tora TaxID=362788 RepID=A0A834T061_9FABA|nr:uncharacterized protein G2W53_033478 [Senna tora]